MGIKIGIDPDTFKSGVAILHTEERRVEVKSLAFPQLMDFLLDAAKLPGVIVYIEAGWHIKGNWHLRLTDGASLAAATGKRTGANHEVGKKIAEMARHYGLMVIEQKPLKKGWKGPSGKITHEEISYFIHGLPKRTNQEERDAALLVWECSSLPVKINVQHGKRETAKRTKT